MNVLSTILSAINKVSFVLLVIIFPFWLLEFLIGSNRLEEFLDRLNFMLDFRTIDTIGIISIVVFIITHIIHERLK